MIRAALCLVLASLPFIASAQSSYYHDYKSFFGKEDRVGLFSEQAKARFSPAVLKSIAANTLLVDCGSHGKPSTGFLLKSKDGTHIITAAHNVQLATTAKPCRINHINETAAQVHNFKPHSNYKNTATLTDAGFDVATAESATFSGGLDICESIDLTSAFIVPQSYDGTGYLALPPTCRITKVSGAIITTTCRGHYKASGAPLLSIKEDKICVAGVFNAHSGSLMKYESYAANMVSGN